MDKKEEKRAAKFLEGQLQLFLTWCDAEEAAALTKSGEQTDPETLLRLLYLAHKIGLPHLGIFIITRIAEGGTRMKHYLDARPSNMQAVETHKAWEDDFIAKQRLNEERDWLTERLKGDNAR